MTPQELIERKNRSSSVAYHKFVLISAKLGASTFYCFVEGNDDTSYYVSRILHYFDNCEPVVCYSKVNVLEIFSKIRSIQKYDHYKKGFFIDRDFDPPCDIPEVYETTYSIENLYCSPEFFSRILKHEFHVTEDQTEFMHYIDFFNNRQTEFHDSVLLLNAWYYSVKMESVNQKVKIRVCLGDTLPKGFIRIDLLSGIKQLYGIDDIKASFPDAINVDDNCIQKSLNELKAKDGAKVFRGKYELQFMKAILRFLITHANEKNKKNLFHMKTKFNFQNDLFLSQLSQYADTPECLNKYLTDLKTKN